MFFFALSTVFICPTCFLLPQVLFLFTPCFLLAQFTLYITELNLNYSTYLYMSFEFINSNINNDKTNFQLKLAYTVLPRSTVPRMQKYHSAFLLKISGTLKGINFCGNKLSQKKLQQEQTLTNENFFYFAAKNCVHFCWIFLILMQFLSNYGKLYNSRE